MATTTWINFNNGDTGAVVRTALNAYNTGIAVDVAATEARVTATEGLTTTNTANIVTNTADIATNVSDITTLQGDQANFGTLLGQTTPLFALTTSPATLTGYVSGHAGTSVVVDALAGTITPQRTGYYRVTAILSFEFDSSTVTRTITIGLGDGAVLGEAYVNVPKSATKDAESMTAIMPLVSGVAYKLSLSASEAMSITSNFSNFSIEFVGV